MPAMIMLQFAPFKLSSPTQMTSPASMQRLLRASLLFAVGAALAVGSAISPAAASMIRDTEIEADDQAALEKLGVSSKGKRAVEDGFVGCALLGGMADAAGSAPSEPMVIDT